MLDGEMVIFELCLAYLTEMTNFSETLGIPLLPLVRYCMEGDNTEDGRLLASASISALSIDVPVRVSSIIITWLFYCLKDHHF